MHRLRSKKVEVPPYCSGGSFSTIMKRMLEPRMGLLSRFVIAILGGREAPESQRLKPSLWRTSRVAKVLDFGGATRLKEAGSVGA